MEHLMIPENYESALSLHDTQVAIKTVKDFFQQLLAERLNLLRVSAPLFVAPESGLNDNLNGVERPVGFDILESGRDAETGRRKNSLRRCSLSENSSFTCSSFMLFWSILPLWFRLLSSADPVDQQ